jgi:hypothetical protein
MFILAVATTGFSFSQSCKPCLDTVQSSLTLLSKSSIGGTNCLFTVKFCLRKISDDAKQIDYFVYHTNGDTSRTIDVSGVSVGTIICEEFTFVADCNSTASFIAFGKQTSNSVCGIVSDLILLPIKLLSFSAEIQKSGIVNFQWQTGTETNSSYFIIQQSNDGKAFQDIGKVKATGQSNILKQYTYEYKSSAATGISNNNYYRLKMVDRDNSYSFSQIIHIGKSANRIINVYPNPATHILRIDKDDLDKGNLKMFNIQGQELSLTWDESNALNLMNLNQGIYFIKYKDEFIRFVKE